MRLASFNVENMFQRPRVLQARDFDSHRPILDAFAALQALLAQASYSDTDKTRIIDHLHTLGLASRDESEWAYLRRSRGQLVRRKRDGTLEVIANGRGAWIGWLELKKEPVDEVATRNTARVIAAIDADALAVIEAEDRNALVRFNQEVLPYGTPRRRPSPYEHTMLIDGNDDRGIDVGLFTKANHPIRSIRSHVDDRSASRERIFSRDCPEYLIDVPGGSPMLLLVNHFKSKGYGPPAASSAKRKAQATRVAAIYRERRDEGYDRIAIVGDFNDTPASEPLKPLLGDTDLRDVSVHPNYTPDERGTATYATSRDKIDYILLSPALFDTVTAAAVNRSGVWHGPRVKNAWTMLDTLTRPEEQASDHAAIWCDLNV
jgi:endonuclease/exonuclease/phosphatase family metal-dependent hydrolase